jgi:hypothetical protein
VTPAAAAPAGGLASTSLAAVSAPAPAPAAEARATEPRLELRPLDTTRGPEATREPAPALPTGHGQGERSG